MGKVIANNHEHNLPQYKRCTCGDDMKLRVMEDTSRNVTYFYDCTLDKKYCGRTEQVYEEV